jgi:predicted transposase YdaD
MDSITKYIKEEDDYLFKKGEQKGKQKGILEGKQEAILKFLKDGLLTTKQLASYFDVTEDFVEQLRKQL